MLRLVKSLLVVCAFVAIPIESASALDGKISGLLPRLVKLLRAVENHFGRTVVVTSGCRSYSHNRRIGGAKQSYHIRCLAADVKVAGVHKSVVVKYAKSLSGRGGVGTYCRDTSTHIDVGPRREWIWTCNGRRINSGAPGRPVRMASN